MIQRSKNAMLILLCAVLLAACNLPVSPITATPNERERVNTAAAKTLAALATEVASGKSPTLPGSVTTTPMPTFTGAPSRQAPSPTTKATQGNDCLRASFVRDVTIPDGSTLLANSTFTKTWELKNSGSCTWDSRYSVVFAGKGSAMSGPASTPITTDRQVKPGESVEVSVSLRAPGEPGDYEGYWMLRSDTNQTFGTGANGASPFFLKINVSDNYYSFAEHVCSAQWSSGAGSLPCPGKEGDSQGYVLPLENPTLEDNQEREGRGILTMPQPVGGGMIVGKFPAVIVPNEADFRSVISCQPGASGCYVRFRVTYRVDNGEEQLLGEWNEGSEGGVTNAIKDLNMVAGRSTAFYFYVYVNGTPDQSKAIWFDAKVTK